MTRSRFIVGIDLGTTHTVVAYAETATNLPPAIFPVAQLVGPTEVATRPLLASALYAPIAEEAIADPWDEAPFVVGEYAVARGTQVPGRFVASAKSWLSHAAVDREAPILPWGLGSSPASEVGPARISPVDASALYLRHVRTTWDAAFPESPLAAQEVVLTVPASFDPSARELTVSAARRAGLAVSLLEEPQAAFYHHLASTPAEPLLALIASSGGEALVLVCDVGGGTTDLSLLRLTATGARAHAGTAPACAAERIAVGRHLLLGGDNMDLLLAHTCEARFGASLGPAEHAQLSAACRDAKERLLADHAPERVPVAVLAAGSQLLGSARATELTRDEVRKLLLDAFFPVFPAPHSQPERRARPGLLGLGLPYERDVAITAHVAEFLRRHAPQGRGPDALLLNGGVFRAHMLSDRLREVVQSWGGAHVGLLANDAPDLAVARGGVAYGQARAGRGARIESRSPHGYYVGLEAPLPGQQRRALSVLPRGARADEVHRALGRTFALTVGRPARFDLFQSSGGHDDATHVPGEVVVVDDSLTPMPPISVHLQAGAGAEASAMVELEGMLSAIGTLDLTFVERDAEGGESRRFQLAFELSRAASASASTRPLGPTSTSREHDGKRMSEASALIEQAFGPPRGQPSPRAAKELIRDLERVLGDRSTWSSDVTRALFDQLVRDPAARKRSLDHERVFWMLAGFTARPGFGYPGDDARMAKVAPLFSEMLTYEGEMRGFQQLWIAWRRMAPGLAQREQTRMRDLVDPFLAPAELRLKKRKGLRPLALDELLDMVSHLERLEPGRRTELGQWVVERTYTGRDHRLFAAIARIGARVPAYASAHHVIAPAIAEGWIDHLLRERWEVLPAAGEAALELARLTGDRARDVSDALRSQVKKRWARAGFADERLEPLRAVVQVHAHDAMSRFGESLPAGLRLLD